MLTRKDYEMLAKAIRTVDARYAALYPAVAGNNYRNMVLAELMMALLKDNPNFNSQRFLKACEMETR